MAYGPRQKRVRAYRGQIPWPGRPTVAWREDRVKFWAAIKSGVMTEDAAATAGVSAPVAFRWFRHAGGVNPGLAATVSGRYLSFSEREDIALMKARGMGVREIARAMGRDPSTVSRGLRRNASTRAYHLDYKASTAQWHAERRARRPKAAKLLTNERLREYVQDRLAGEIRTPDGRVVAGPQGPQFKGRNKPHRGDRAWVSGWSPEQISRRLRAEFPDDESMRISHEAIYQALYVQSRGGLKRELVACLRTGRALRVPRARAKQRAWAHVTDATLISERPAEADDRAVPGHWEGDLIIGLQRSAIGTLVERSTRFTMLIHLPREEGWGVIPRTKNGPPLAGYGAVTMSRALAATITTLPQQLWRSLTWDRGKELSAHAAFTVETGVPVSSPSRTVPGSAAPTRTPTDCCASTSRKAPTYPDGLPKRSTRSLTHSTAGHGKHSAGRLPPKPSTNIYDHFNRTVLRRPVESEGVFSHRWLPFV
ncbi:IS30-like element ISMsm8 family transposase [Actinoplanes sichuanensis]|nr:IS30-like element ISMsm8 family transposase [Actinoplanes sichuanensis]